MAAHGAAVKGSSGECREVVVWEAVKGAAGSAAQGTVPAGFGKDCERD